MVNSYFSNSFREHVSDSQKEDILNNYVDIDDENAIIASWLELKQSYLDNVPSLQRETNLYMLVLNSIVTGINNYLIEKLNQKKETDKENGVRFYYYSTIYSKRLVDASYIPNYPNAPELEVDNGIVLIPYQINLAYKKYDLSGRDQAVDPELEVPDEPSLRGSSPYSIQFGSESYPYPGDPLEISDNSFELFEKGIEIFYIQPIYYPNNTYPSGSLYRKVIVLNSANDMVLNGMLTEAKNIFYTFEKLIYEVKDSFGSYPEMLGMFSIANGYDKQIDALRYKNSILRFLLG